ncbi:hypothetical protein [Streptomyces sp. NPDC093589]|uniref:hypothetical protein n=1 Tax=Streptomyces sp. NPDC093589 TaxID=3366043 RepID=UPI003810C7CE
MLSRTQGKGRLSSLYAGANAPRWRTAVMAGALVTVSVVALGTASAASQGSEEPTQAAVQAAPATDSVREHWKPPTVRSDGPAGPQPGKINTDYLISEVSPAQFRGYWYQSHVKGVSVTWVAPSGRDPYNGWDWIEIQDSNAKRVTWDWACGNANCGAYGSTLIDAKLTKGAKYKALYFSDGGRVTKGHLQAEFEFWA